MAKKEVATSEEMPETPATPEEGAQETAEVVEEQEPSITEKLFPDMIPQEDAEATPEVAETEDAKEATESTPEETEALPGAGEQKFTTKVDGVEKEVTLTELLKGYQTNQHLANEGQKIGEMRQELEQIKQEMRDSVATDTPEPEYGDIDYVDDATKSLLGKMQAKIDTLEQSVSQVNTATADVQFEKSLKVVDSNLKAMGMPDFMEYKDKVEAEVKKSQDGLPAEQAQALWTEENFMNTYQHLKLQDMIAGTGTKTETGSKNVDNRPMAKVIPIESSASKPSGADSTEAIYQAAVQKAKDSGNWNEVLKLKGVIR